MAIAINSTELTSVLNSTPSRHNIMLVGKHGIGKSEILSKYYSEKGMRVVTLFLGQMSDPGDLIGLPHKNENTGRTEFMPPYWFPVDGKPVVLFLDELNRARPEVLQTVMDLVLNRKLAGKALPEGSRVISAVNDGEEYQLTDLDPALVSRFNVYTFRPTPQDWLLWAEKNGIDKRVVKFINEHPQMLDGDGVNQIDRGLEKTPDRRAWVRVSDIIAAEEGLTSFHQKLVAGVIGVSVAAQFFKGIKQRDMPSAADVLLNYDKHKTDIEGLTIDKLATMNDEVMRFIETRKLTAKEEPKVVENMTKYIDFLRNDRKEGMAHFISCIEKGSYPQSTVFLVSKMPGVYAQFSEFIHKL
jgi:hypothetical protein